MGGGGKGKPVVVRDSGGSYGAALQKAIYTPFTQETGIQVQVLNLDNAPLLAQIKQGRPQCDLINDSMMSFAKYAAEDALETLDRDRLKSLKSAKIPEAQTTDHAIGHSFYGQCIAYRTDAFGGRCRRTSPSRSRCVVWGDPPPGGGDAGDRGPVAVRRAQAA